MHRRALLTLCLVAITAQAQAHKVLLFPPDASPGDAFGQIGDDASAFFRTQPSCRKGELPCRRRAHDGTKLWAAESDGQGGCVIPTIVILAGRQSFRVGFRVGKDCVIRFRVFGSSERRTRRTLRTMPFLAAATFARSSPLLDAIATAHPPHLPGAPPSRRARD